MNAPKAPVTEGAESVVTYTFSPEVAGALETLAVFIDQQAEELRRRETLVEDVLLKGEALVNAITQDAEGNWLVEGVDPELTVCDFDEALSELRAALQPPPPASEGQIGGGE